MISAYGSSANRSSPSIRSFNLSTATKPEPSLSISLNFSLALSLIEGGPTSSMSLENNTVKWVSDPSNHTGHTGDFRNFPTSKYLRHSKYDRKPTEVSDTVKYILSCTSSHKEVDE